VAIFPLVTMVFRRRFHGRTIDIIISAAWNSIKELPQNKIALFIADFLNAV
jgi:hypothetical protein